LSVLKKLASQTAVYGLSQIVGRFINYLLVPLHTAVFATADYGINTMMYAYVTFFNVLLTYGMETAFFRFSQKSNQPLQAYGTALRSLMVSSTVFILLLFLFAPSVAGLIGIKAHSQYIIFFAIIIAVDAVCAVPFAYLRQQNMAVKFALIKNANIFINILFNIYFLLLCPWVYARHAMLLPFYEGHTDVGFIFIANLIASIITVPLLWKEFWLLSKTTFDSKLWKELMRYGLPLMVVGFAGMINETLDRIIIGYFYETPQKGLEATGIYGAAYKLSIIMSLFIQAFRYAAEPFFFNQAAASNQRLVYAKVMNYFVVVCVGLFLLVMLYIDLFKYFINEKYWEGLQVVPILLIANLFLGIYFNLSIWYKLSDQTNKGATISATGAAITLVANLLLVPYFGYVGSAWATLICYISMAIMGYMLGAKYYPIPYQVGRIFLYIILGLCLFFLSLYVQQWFMLQGLYLYAVNAVLLVSYLITAIISETRNKALSAIA
jgi:O-antigen/teichoic acid export membrane protein